MTTTSDVKVTEGSGKNVAAYSITEDAETKQIQRVSLNDSTGVAVAFVPNAAASGATESRVNAANSTNATNLKASAGNVYDIDVYNTAAYPVYLKFYDKASPPTVGSDTPLWTVPIGPTTGYSKTFSYGFSLATGIAYAITKLQADSDTTAVAADDLTGKISWA